ncbi:MAG: filamentous hemagglutinin N-terminal domain-containing protein, partial [Burkholderiaceae bacterium]|nr:filamentous hemagglutinin N-terminal domain-containing protein [Burkholderiaceae bacterium]
MLKYAILNGAYRLAMSELRKTWIAVAEAAGMRGKRASGMIATIALLAPGANVAAADAPPPTQLPVGGQVAAGQVAIASSGTRMDVTQSSSSAVVNWDSFSVGSQAHVNFDQPSAAAVILNRVQGSDPSAIFGRISANGSVFLTNPSGILFAPGAQVDVGGLVASSLGISDANFLAGKYRFEKVGAGGTVVNQGNLNAASGGFVALIAPQVSNSGSIEATKGSVGLAAGDTVNLDFDHDGLLSFQVNVAIAAARADNSGVLIADGGRVVMNVQARDALLSTVLNNDGVIRARSLESRKGEIWLGGGNSGVVSVSGTLDASGTGAGETGGVIHVLGNRIQLIGAAVNASGDAGGGEILLGGDLHGQGAVANAAFNTIDQNSSVRADAINAGNGGKVIVWSDNTTRYFGAISARGGAVAGDGGFVEVSGKSMLAFHGTADRRAPNGAAGMLLLDPTDLTISATGPDTAEFGTGVCVTAGCSNATETVSTLTTATLATALAGGPVNVNATTGAGGGGGTINWTDGAVNASANSLTLTGTTITFNGTLTNLANLIFSTAPTGAGTATSSTGGAITGLGATAFNLSGASAGTAGGITFNGFAAADSTAVTGANGFDDTAKSNQGISFAAATTVAGTGTTANVSGSFADDTLISTASGIDYAGFTGVTGSGTALTGMNGSFDDSTR